MKRYQGKARTRILNDDEIRAVWAAADSHGQFGVADCNQDENCYYTINATKHAMSKKPSKGNIGWVEYLHVDADPNEDESPEQFKARSQTLIEGFELQPTFIVDSGNGIQLLWKVEPAIEVTGPEDFADVEAHNYALAEALVPIHQPAISTDYFASRAPQTFPTGRSAGWAGSSVERDFSSRCNGHCNTYCHLWRRYRRAASIRNPILRVVWRSSRHEHGHS